MATVRLASFGEATRLVARTCATGTLDEAVRVTRDVFESLGIALAVWQAEQGVWRADGSLPIIPDPFDDHDWAVVPVVVGGQEVVAVLMTPSADPGHADLLATMGELLACAAMRRGSDERVANLALRFQEFQELSAIGSFEWLIPTGELHWSSQMFVVHGRDRRRWEPTYVSWIEQVHPDDRDDVAQLHLEALGRGGDWRSEHRIIRALDDAVRTVSTAGRVVQAPDGRPLRMSGICTDVTMESRAQELAVDAFDAAARAEARRSAALELNDTVVQGLTMSAWSIDEGDIDGARQATVRTLEAARRMMNRLLVDAPDAVRPGDLVRSDATPSMLRHRGA